jgi:hypothetical protein
MEAKGRLISLCFICAAIINLCYRIRKNFRGIRSNFYLRKFLRIRFSCALVFFSREWNPSWSLSNMTNPSKKTNGGVSSLQVAAHRKPVLTLLRMRDILARMMWRRPTLTLTSLQCSTTLHWRNVGSGGMRRSILATDFCSADAFY